MADRTTLESIRLTAGDAEVLIAPARGGMATRYVVGGQPVFYLDEATLLDPAKNVRGGNPVLFPSPGKLAQDRFASAGREGKLGQHGFARNLAWDVDAGGQTASEVTLRLVASDATRAVYPWDFDLTYRYRLRRTEDEAVLRIDQTFATSSPTPMPFGAGFHPYFAVPQADKPRTRIPTAATRAWDNAAKSATALTGPIDLTAAEVDLHLIDHDAASARLELADGSRIEVRASDELRAWVIWTVRGKDFVCVEPWTSPADALNTGEGLLHATDTEPVSIWTEIAFLRSAEKT